MTVGDGEKGTRRCIGYPAFWKAWTAPEKNEFRPWFSQIEEGLEVLFDTRRLRGKEESQLWGFRVMQVQHLLVELADALDPTSSRIHAHSRPLFEPTTAPVLPCICTHCMDHKIRHFLTTHSCQFNLLRYDTSEILSTSESLAGKYWHCVTTGTKHRDGGCPPTILSLLSEEIEDQSDSEEIKDQSTICSYSGRHAPYCNTRLRQVVVKTVEGREQYSSSIPRS